MSAPAADLPAPLAVLVLAWEEAAPAVRALVEATAASTPLVDSVLVMVPQADAPNHLSAEEYLPLPAAQTPEPAPPPTVAAPLPHPELMPPPAETPVPIPATNTLLRAEALEEDGGPATDEPLPGLPSPTPASSQPALTWSAVRILRLGSYSLESVAQLAGQPLPAPTWPGPAAQPAAPYLGAELLATPVSRLPQPAPGLADAPGQAPTAAPGAAGPLFIGETAASTLSSEQPRIAPLATPAEPPQTAALETDLLPSPPDELELFELASPETDSPAASLAVASHLPEQAGWSEALASLRQPTDAASVAAEVTPPMPALSSEPATAAHPALRPAASHYPAPDLNFRIIQYARFAVPVALATGRYDAIYAPAWPTWLAAQELRQRTGLPLVLHVAALAAAENESADIAAGWIAELQRQALRRADLVLTETPALAQRLHHELGLAAGTVRVIAAADTTAIAQALHEARPRLVASPA